MRIRFWFIFTGLLLLSFQPLRLQAHEIPDGFVERTMGIVVRSDTAYLKFSVGVSPATIRAVMTQWNCSADTFSPVLDDEELIRNFQTVAINRMADKIVVTIDDNPIELQKVSCERSPRHHFTVEAKYRFVFPTTDAEFSKLKITDRNFLEYNGAARYSCKATGTAKVSESSVAPIIVRAKRHLLDSMSIDERKRRCQIESSIGHKDRKTN